MLSATKESIVNIVGQIRSLKNITYPESEDIKNPLSFLHQCAFKMRRTEDT